MKFLPLALIAALGLSSGAFAQGSAPAYRNTPAPDQVQGLGSTYSSHLVRSGNDCAPDNAQAVWGPGNSLAGYSCYSYSGGS